MDKRKCFDDIEECIRPGVVIEEMGKSCHYHRVTEFIGWQRVLPQGLQPSFFYVLYPYLLAITYGGNIPAGQEFRCPGATVQDNSRPVFTIRRKPLDRRERVKNFVKTLLAPARPMGRTYFMPEIETKGGSYPFDLGSKGTLCPAAFRSFFPYLALSYLKRKSGGVESGWKICCPDHLKNLLYGSGKIDQVDFQSICFFGNSARIQMKSPCRSNMNVSISSLEDIAKILNFPCPSLLNVVYGYYLTLATGGELAFYSKSFGAAIAQCPNPASRVVVEICRRSGTISVEILDVIGNQCPRGIKKGNIFFFPRDTKKNSFCLDAFNSLFLYCGLAEYCNMPISVTCVFNDCKGAWQINFAPKH